MLRRECNRGQREVVGVPLLELQPHGLAGHGGLGDAHAGQDLIGGDARLTQRIPLTREDEEVLHEHAPRPGRPHELDLRIQRGKSHCQIAWMHDVARPAAQDRVVAVLPVVAEALGPPLLEAGELLHPVVPAARALVEVAPQGRLRPDLRTRDRLDGLEQHPEPTLATLEGRLRREGLERREGGQRADPHGRALVLDAGEPGDGLQVHHHVRLDEVLLHLGQEVLTTREEAGPVVPDGVGQEPRRLLDTPRQGHLEGLHPFLPRASRTRSGVIGRARTRAPQAL